MPHWCSLWFYADPHSPVHRTCFECGRREVYVTFRGWIAVPNS